MDLDGVADPFLCHYLGTSGTLYLKGNAYSSDAFEAYSASKLVGEVLVLTLSLLQ